MLPGVDPVAAPPSLTARRPAANNLGPFELPPPPASLVSKYQPFTSLNGSGGSVTSVGNLLTPPNTIPSESLSPVSTGMHSNAIHSNHDATSPSNHISPAQNVSPFASPSFLLQSSHSSSQSQYPFSSGSTPQWMPPRNLFSPTSLNSMMRSNASTQSNEGVPSSSYDMNHLPSFSNTLSMSAPSSLPGMHGGQAALMGGHHMPMSAPHASPMSQHDGFSRPLTTPTYYGHSSASSASSQQGHYHPGSGPSPTMTASSQSTHRSPITAPSSDMSMSSHHVNQYQRPYNQYSLPAMNGPVMSNLHSPSGQMSLVGGMPNMIGGGFNSGHAANMQHMYSMQHHVQQQQQPQERPFKCDQCIQSFNRNHDLKRHKRIHLAVKPFPCGHCEKSFSRKDALKRHILVKSCGKAATADNDNDTRHDSSSSPGEPSDEPGPPSRQVS